MAEPFENDNGERERERKKKKGKKMIVIVRNGISRIKNRCFALLAAIYFDIININIVVSSFTNLS